MQKNSLKKLLQFLNITLTILVFVFAYIYGKDLLSKADFGGLADNYGYLILAYILFFGFYILFSLHWLYICRLIDGRASNKQILAFFASQPYKYLPTSIFTFSFRAKFAKQAGMPLKQSSYAQLLENFDIVLGGAAVSATLYIYSHSVLYGLLAAVVGVAILGVAHHQKLTIKVPRKNRTIPVYKMASKLLLMCAGWLVAGLSFWCVSKALGFQPNIALMIAANAAAYVASILAVFAPGGIGVRELILKWFSAQNAAVVLWRLLTFSVDIILGISAIFAIRALSKK